jgi:UDP-N-acetyl-D-mannosaminuronate dehydrogenase
VRKDHAHDVRFVELAHEVNSEMPRHVVGRASLLLNREGKAVKGARILGVGVAYKGGTEDTRGAPGLKVLDQLAKQGAKVSYLDPLVPQVAINGAVMTSVGSGEDVSQYDLVITLIPQHDVDWERISKNCRLALDCCRVLSVTDDRVERL